MNILGFLLSVLSYLFGDSRYQTRIYSDVPGDAVMRRIKDIGGKNASRTDGSEYPLNQSVVTDLVNQTYHHWKYRDENSRIDRSAAWSSGNNHPTRRSFQNNGFRDKHQEAVRIFAGSSHKHYCGNPSGHHKRSCRYQKHKPRNLKNLPAATKNTCLRTGTKKPNPGEKDAWEPETPFREPETWSPFIT